ncbi:recombination protein RecR [bacterium (Candidatus Gribaldobacteria) CG08_land_8_20_14_0_20_39_15]|uniref:Recombination protein RecR n=1 Tax=bacterium (Candidatus Gribaldobacteria) CG08_land_8_20_14_0_20_39_15 TaxID=2014273 RepID=A0A2M6XVA5_9BACT|nr:MAG: recombination protein RecR [bacterium (Candidatus Gribaldobacteria) CG08_land_8_20_14_0_20_39_15]
MLSPTVQKLADLFAKFPTVGQRTARRFTFYLIKNEQKKIDDLITAIKNLKNKIKLCALCGKSFENEEQKSDLCAICSDSRRDKTVVCIVEKEVDLETIEKTKQFAGLYFIWDTNNEEQQLKKIISRIKKEPIKEIILALNPTLDGRQLVLKIQRNLQELGIKITQLGRGLPVGGEIEYADEETITSAFESRK